MFICMMYAIPKRNYLYTYIKDLTVVNILTVSYRLQKASEGKIYWFTSSRHLTNAFIYAYS